MTTEKVTLNEVRHALEVGRVVIAYPRLRKIALDGFPPRPATRAALDLIKQERIDGGQPA